MLWGQQLQNTFSDSYRCVVAPNVSVCCVLYFVKLSWSWNVLYRSSLFTVNGSVPNDMYDVPPWRISTKGNSLSIAPRLSSFDVRPTMRLFDIVLPMTVFHSPMPDLMFSRSV